MAICLTDFTTEPAGGAAPRLEAAERLPDSAGGAPAKVLPSGYLT